MTYRRNSCRQPATTVARIMVLFQFVDIGLISATTAYRQYHRRCGTAHTVNQPLTQLLMSQANGRSWPVRQPAVADQLRPSKYQFLHCRQAVAEVGNANLQARNPVIFRAALLILFCWPDSHPPAPSREYRARSSSMGVDDIFDFD